MLKIYGSKTFNAVKAVMTAEECGAQYEYIQMDFAKGDHKKPEYLKIHPLGKIPAMEDNGNPIFESNNMCRYIANISSKKLYSENPLMAANIDQTVDVIGYHVGKWITTYFFQEIVMRVFRGAEPDASAISEAKGFLDEQLPYLDAILADNDFLCGDNITIADTVAMPMFMICDHTSFDFSEYNNISRWYKMMKARPSYAATMVHFPDGYNFG
ncbi:MAG: glutathione S-transferase family protein [Emcibacteraceae bacterium]|nr:glutathione S-transferase family protein [Emcibacteraceae bacterium]MDG1996953.1 glutathione S-transferase family protein [Emcibacteraceae bacterium]